MSRLLPLVRPGQTVGLLGGSFDPPHIGHARLTLHALKRFGLDQVWWLVSPGNPLKHQGPAPMAARIAAANAVIRHPRVTVTGLEAQLGTVRTADTLAALQARAPGVRFVWLMGADNLAQFHRWDRWRDILRAVPVGVIARPGDRISARMSPAARRFRAYRISGTASRLLASAQAPAWCFVNMPMVAESSSAIRRKGGWQRPG